MNTIVQWTRCVAIFALATCCAGAKESEMRREPMKGSDASNARHLTTKDRIGDLLGHSAFAGFAPLLLPWDGRAYDERMPLTNIGSLLPYHSQIRPDVVVGALNRMIDDATNGSRIFYEFYNEQQRREDTDRQRTGLFFFRGRPGAPFAMISPGGGFSYVGSLHEGFPYAVEISRQGYNAFVLKYRAGRGADVATQDLAAAIAFVRQNAKDLDVDAEGYSVWGSSAGARMAAFIGSHGTARYGADEDSRPTAVVMAYTGHSDVSSDEPPTFVVVGARDGIAPPSSMERRVTALRNIGTVVEYRKFDDVGHGFGLGTGTSAEGWLVLAVRFWESAIRSQRR
jgi:acetyl esterase/lipase